MSTELVYLHQTKRGIWEVSLDHVEWARFPATATDAPAVIDEVRRIFSRKLVALEGPRRVGAA